MGMGGVGVGCGLPTLRPLLAAAAAAWGGNCRTKEDDLEGGVTCQYLYVYFFCFV